MIREGKKLPTDVLTRIPSLIKRLSKDEVIIAIYAFGSLPPLSDLDFGILLTHQLNIEKTTKIYLDFKFFRDNFDRVFLKGIGYNG